MRAPRDVRRAASTLWKADLGQSMVEVALTLPMLAFTLLGGAEMARAFSAQLAVENAARAGAETAVLDTAVIPTTSAATTSAQNELGRTPGVTAGSATINVSFLLSDGVTTCTSSASQPCYATVRVRYTFSTLVQWPGLPNTFNLDRTVKMRRYQ